MKARSSVVIIGGGIAGLAAAWELSGGADGPTADGPRIEVIEAAPDVGGCLRTVDFFGRTLDAGADGFLARRPEAAQLVREVGRGGDLLPIDATGAWLWLDGALNPLPEGHVLGVPTSTRSLRPLTGLSARARRAAWRDEHLPRRFTPAEDASIGAIVRAKLGDELATQVVEPLVGGIQAGRIDELSAAAVFPALVTAAATGGSLMKAIRPPQSNGGAAGPVFLTVRGGLGSLPATVRARLEERGVIVTTDTRVSHVRWTPTSFYSWEVDTAASTTPASALIVATPAPEAARLLGAHDTAIAALRAIDSASCSIVTLSAPRAAVTLPPTGTGVLVPLGTVRHGESMVVTAVTLLDRKWPHLTTDDTVLVRCHTGRIDDRRALGMPDDELVARVRAELAAIIPGWPPDGPATVARFPDALPQYRVGHGALVAAARTAARARRALLAGNAYDGVGVPASIGSGRRAAAEVREMLASD